MKQGLQHNPHFRLCLYVVVYRFLPIQPKALSYATLCFGGNVTLLGRALSTLKKLRLIRYRPQNEERSSTQQYRLSSPINYLVYTNKEHRLGVEGVASPLLFVESKALVIYLCKRVVSNEESVVFLRQVALAEVIEPVHCRRVYRWQHRSRYRQLIPTGVYCQKQGLSASPEQRRYSPVGMVRRVDSY